MTRDLMNLSIRVLWCVLASLIWLRAYRGWSTTPRFDMWFWGIAAILDLLAVGAVIERLQR